MSELKDIDKNNNAERTRIQDAQSARTIYKNLWDGDRDRRNAFSEAKGQIDGVPPLNNNELTQDGNEWMYNYNTGGGRADFIKFKGPYYPLIMENATLVQAEFYSNEPKTADYERHIESEFDLAMTQWRGFPSLVRKLINSTTGPGIGIAFWADPYDPRPTRVDVPYLLIDDDTDIDTEEWELFVIPQTMTVCELMDKRGDPKSGWNDDVINTAIHLGKQSNQPFWDDALEIERQWKNNSSYLSRVTKKIHVAHVFAKEFSGQWSCRIVTIDESTTIDNQTRKIDKFLYENQSFADHVSQIICPIYLDEGDGTYHSVRGFWLNNYAAASVQNRLVNQMLNNSVLYSGMQFRNKGSVLPDQRATVMDGGTVTVFPENIEEIKARPNTDILMNSLETISALKAETDAAFKSDTRSINQAKSATQAEIIDSQGAVQTQATYSPVLLGFSIMFHEMIRRMLLPGSPKNQPYSEMVSTFQKRAYDVESGGIPREFIKKYPLLIFASASAGITSPAQRSALLKFWMSSGALSPEQEQLMKAEALALDLGASSSRRYQAVSDLGTLAIEAQQEAIIENTTLGSGTILPVSPNENHIVHFDIHFDEPKKLAIAYASTPNMQMDAQSMQRMNALMLHSQDHLDLASQDASLKNETAPRREEFQQAMNIFGGMISKFEEQATNAQIQQQGISGPAQV